MALSLKRKVNESVMIGDDITVTVTKITAGAVWLSFVAPGEVKIWRSGINLYYPLSEAKPQKETDNG